ncbi:MAG: hypothetical protein RR334_00920 [Clostridia bacterium]
MGLFNKLLKRSAYKEALKKIEIEDKLGVDVKSSKSFGEDDENVKSSETRLMKSVTQLYPSSEPAHERENINGVSLNDKSSPISASKNASNAEKVNMSKLVVEQKYKNNNESVNKSDAGTNSADKTKESEPKKSSDWLKAWLEMREKEYQEKTTNKPQVGVNTDKPKKKSDTETQGDKD